MTYALVLYALAFGQVMLMYGLMAPAAIRMIERAFLGRNVEWTQVHGQPPATARLRRVFVVLVMGMGCGQMVALFLLGRVPMSYSAPVLALIAPLPGMAIVIGGYAWRGYRAIYLAIPAPAVRTTTLKRRRIGDFVSPWVMILPVLLAVSLGLNYVRAVRELLLPAHLLTARGALFAVAAAILGFAIIRAVRRRDGFTATAGGEGARRLEIGLYLIGLYALLFSYPYLLMADIANMPFPPSFVMMATGFGVLQVYGLYVCQLTPATATEARSFSLRAAVQAVAIYIIGMAGCLVLAHVALGPEYARQKQLAAAAPGDGLNASDVQSWVFTNSAGKPVLQRELRQDASLPGGAYWHVLVPGKGHERWDTLVRSYHVKPVRRGDVVEAEVWLRSDAPGGAEINGLTQSTRWGWTPIGKASWRVGPVWKLYRVRGVATEDYGIGESDFELHLASGTYAFDLGPAKVVDLGGSASLGGSGGLGGRGGR